MVCARARREEVEEEEDSEVGEVEGRSVSEWRCGGVTGGGVGGEEG